MPEGWSDTFQRRLCKSYVDDDFPFKPYHFRKYLSLHPNTELKWGFIYYMKGKRVTLTQ